MSRRLLCVLSLVVLLAVSASAGSPIARFQTVLGDFDVILDPVAAPISVTNFATYANRGTYDTTIIHRSTTGNPFNIQVVQGGGFELVTNMLVPVSTDPPIPLEAGVPNTRGTIAMARGDDINSATSQWYFNATDNPELNFNYTVFGSVLGKGMSVVDAIAGVTVYDASEFLGPAFGELPLFADVLTAENLVLIDSVRVEPFTITNITRTGDTTELRWTALSTNTPVRVERTYNLTGGPWTPIATNLTTGIVTEP